MKTTEFIRESAEKYEYDDEVGMVKNNLHTLVRMCIELAKSLDEHENVPEWAQEKIAVAKSMIVAVGDYMISQHEMGHQLQVPGFDPEQAFAEAMGEQGVAEAWSEKYKRSINCSHPKGFSQRAHCAGKKKHNEDITMEMTCPDCGMCQTHGTLNEIKKGQKDANGFTSCWPNKHAEGTKRGKNGGWVRKCVPNEGVAGGLNEDLQADDGEYYSNSDDFFSQFEADHFDQETTSPDGMEVRGYINGVCVMAWRFKSAKKIGGWGIYDDSALEQDMEEGIDPQRAKAGKIINRCFGKISEYEDDGWEYLDRNAPVWYNLFGDDQYGGDIDAIIANAPIDLLVQSAKELTKVVSDLPYELDETGYASRHPQTGGISGGRDEWAQMAGGKKQGDTLAGRRKPGHEVAHARALGHEGGDEKEQQAKLKAALKAKLGVAEGEITKTATGKKHRSTSAYGGTHDHNPLRTLDKTTTNRIDRAIGVKFNREKKFSPGLDLKENATGGATASGGFAVSMSQEGRMPNETIARQKTYTNQRTPGGPVKIKKAK